MSSVAAWPVRAAQAVAQARPESFWLDSALAPDPAPQLAADTRCDLAVVGGGYGGLWTALLAKERDPGRDVLVLEAGRVGAAASGRNGGFCAASLTHGLPNGQSRWPAEMPLLHRLGLDNLDAIEQTLLRYGIDCDWRRTGDMTVAVEPWQLQGLAEAAELSESLGSPVRRLDRDEVQAEVHSATYLAAIWDPTSVALVDPARLAWGLYAACGSLGVRFAEGTPVTGLSTRGAGARLSTAYADVDARQVVLATNAFPSLLRRLRLLTVPVYDYALVSGPLTGAQLASIGWSNGQGISDAGNQFHYYRRTVDNRILWGGYDAIYHYGRHVKPEYDQRPLSFVTLAEQFFQTFPQLADVTFSHRWGGAIDTSTRFSAFFGTASHGKVAYSGGYTGLGVGATRFGAEVVLDLLEGADTERTRLEMVRRTPIPFPPDPVGWTGIQATRWSLARADSHQGRRNLWLRGLDKLGLGFDS